MTEETSNSQEINLEETIQKADERANLWENKYKYLLADMDNMRKRHEKDKDNAVFMAKVEILCGILPILDEIDIAYEATHAHILSKSMEDKLKSIGIASYGKIGEVFDSEIHNAIAISNDGKYNSGTISKIVKKGYTYYDDIIRHADVIVEQ